MQGAHEPRAVKGGRAADGSSGGERRALRGWDNDAGYAMGHEVLELVLESCILVTRH